jgi:hypothetical protein
MPTTKLTLDCSPFEEYTFEIEFNYTPFRPGRYSGPPEDCYPDEPEELEITSIKITDCPFISPDVELLPLITDDAMESIYDAVLSDLPGSLEVDIPERDICVDYSPEDAP